MTALLETRGLCKNFGALAATRNVDFKLERGARHALIGPNGAGKTTFVNLITGKLAPGAGAIRLGGEDVTRLGWSTPASRLMNVVLPAPLGPMSAWRAPCGSEKLTSLTAASAPKLRERFSVRSAAVIGAASRSRP